MPGVLAWAATGSTAAWSSDSNAPEPVLLLPITPHPLVFWLGIVQHHLHDVVPIVLFKNAIPLYERSMSHLLRDPFLDAEAWRSAVSACVMRNSGLEGLFARLTESLPFPSDRSSGHLQVR